MTSPALAAPEEHGLALLLSGRCRRCAERIPGGAALRGRPCPHCGEPTLPSALDREVLHALHGQQSTARLWVALVGVGAGALLLGWLPLVASLLVAAALAWLRLTLVKPALQLLSPQRRLVARWTLRLCMGCCLALSLIVLELLTLLPVVSLVVKAALSTAEVALLGSLTRRYLVWQTGRELGGRPVAAWEVGLLAGVLAVLLGLMVGVVAVVVWLVEKLGYLQGWLLGPA